MTYPEESRPMEVADLKERIDQLSEEIHSRYEAKMEVNEDLDRKLVSFQANKKKPFYRWFKYKEAFSADLVEYCFDEVGLDSGHVFDPFAGVGTTLFASRDLGLDSTGVELLPPVYDFIEVRKDIESSDRSEIQDKLKDWIQNEYWKESDSKEEINHINITFGAYPEESKEELSKYLAALNREDAPIVRNALRFAAYCVLEDISYTRKDGQFLRWDGRAKRHNSKWRKPNIKGFSDAVKEKLSQIREDLSRTGSLFENGRKWERGEMNIIQGSVLEELPSLESGTYDGIMTSPPYCNRYDYTRTYALELALMGLGEDDVKDLRQTMLSCTVENKRKELSEVGSLLSESDAVFQEQDLIQSIVSHFKQLRKEGELNNNGIPRMVENYFREMALVIFECARVLKPGAPFIMVNDNVRYQGVVIPVDLILSDIAESAGFETEKVWILPRGKGNSSQQMGEYGRQEVRKCVYTWRKSTG